MGPYADALALDQRIRSPRARAHRMVADVAQRVRQRRHGCSRNTGTAKRDRVLGARAPRQMPRFECVNRKSPIALCIASRQSSIGTGSLSRWPCYAFGCSQPRARRRRRPPPPGPRRAEIQRPHLSWRTCACSRPTSSKDAHRRRAAGNSRPSIWRRRWPRSDFSPRAMDGTFFQQVPIVESTVERTFTLSVPGHQLSLPAGRGRVLGRRDAARAGAGRRGLRRLRHQRAGTEVERLRRRRREGQVGVDHGQRPARAGRRADAVRRPRAHLLRPLDLQVRGSRAAGRGRRTADPHRRIRHLSVAGGAVVVERHAVHRCRPSQALRRWASRPG